MDFLLIVNMCKYMKHIRIQKIITLVIQQLKWEKREMEMTHWLIW